MELITLPFSIEEMKAFLRKRGYTIDSREIASTFGRTKTICTIKHGSIWIDSTVKKLFKEELKYKLLQL